jgi:hypothetical protein
MKLPLRERILNAHAAGFAHWIIAARLGTKRSYVSSVVCAARKEGDTRAVHVPHDAQSWRYHTKFLTSRGALVKGGDDTAYFDDEFPDLPDVYEPIAPLAWRIPQSWADLP